MKNTINKTTKATFFICCLIFSSLQLSYAKNNYQKTCNSHDLRVFINNYNEGMSQVHFSFVIKNTSKHACSLAYTPKLYTNIKNSIHQIPLYSKHKNYIFNKYQLTLTPNSSFIANINTTRCGTFGGKLSLLNTPNIGHNIIYPYYKHLFVVHNSKNARCNGRVNSFEILS